MRVKLVSLDQLTPRSKIVVKRFPALVGRSPEAEVCLSDCWASRRHCEFDPSGGTLVVRDIGSRHGTFVNGQRISEAHVLPGDQLTVGVTSFKVLYRRKRPKPPVDRKEEMASLR